MKKLICVFTFLAMLFSGCVFKGELVQEGKAYNIYRKGEKYYMRVNPGYTTGYSAYSAARTVLFDSIEEMQARILSGDFTYDETKAMSVRAKSAYEMEIVNPFQLYEAYLPSQYVMYMPINFYGNEYHLHYEHEDSDIFETVTFEIVSRDRYLELVDQYNSKANADYKDDLSITVLEDKTDKTTGKRIVSYKSGDSLMIREYVKHLTAERNLYVIGAYSLGGDGVRKGNMYICGEENGGYYNMMISDPPDHVDLQYLSQFGITPYEGNEPPPKAIG